MVPAVRRLSSTAWLLSLGIRHLPLCAPRGWRYGDDIILTASTPTLLQRITERLHSEFAMTDLGDLHHFLGISVTRSSDGLFLSQRQYALDLLQRAGMAECHSTSTPVDAQAKLSATEGSPVTDPTEYRSLAGALQYSR